MKKRRFISILLLIVLCAGLLFSVLPAAVADATDRWDLANFFDQIVLKDAGGNVIPTGGEVALDAYYEFILTFRETAILLFAYDDSGFLRYQLPVDLIAPTPVSNVPILGPGGVLIGNYSITEDGAIRVWFEDCDRFGVPTPGVNLLDQYTDLSFSIDLFAQFVAVGDVVDFDFGNDTTITVTVTSGEENAQLDVVKTHFGYDKSARTIDYEIVITARGGDVENITLRDSLGGTHYVPAELAGASLREITVQIRDEAPFVVSSVPWVDGGNAFLLDFPGVILGDGETIVVTYTLDVDPYIQEWSEVSSGRRNYEFAISNSAMVRGVDLLGNDVTDEHSIWLPVTNYFLNKWGGQPADGLMQWHANIGDGLTRLNGVTITDQMSDGMTIRDATVYAYLYDRLGEFIGFGAVTILPDRSGWTYTVPDGLDGRDIYVVYIDYLTEVDLDGHAEGGWYRNHLSVDLDGAPYIERAVFINPPGIRMDKEYRFLPGAIEWTVRFQIPGALYGEPLWLMDSLDILYHDALGNYAWTTAVNQPENMVVTAYRPGGGAADVFSWTLFDSSDPRFLSELTFQNGWVLFFVDELADHHDGMAVYWENKQLSLSPFTADTVLTITYEIPLDAPLLVDGLTVGTVSGMTTLEDALRQAPIDGNFSAARNRVTAQQDRGVIAQADSMLSWPVHKSAVPVASEDGVFLYTVVLYPGLFALGQPALFVDEFDARLEYVADSFVVIYGGNRFVPRTDGGTDAVLQHITPNGDTNIMTVDLSSPYMRLDAGGAIQPAATGWYASAGFPYVVQYKMRVVDLDVIDLQFYNNMATIHSTTLDHAFTVDYLQTFGTPIVQKSWELSGNTALVDILLNPDGLALTPVGYFEVRDQMSETLSPYLSTVHVSQLIDDAWVLQPLTQVSGVPRDLWTFAVTGDNELTFIFPDSTPLLLEYEVLIKGDVGDMVDIENIITLAGRFSDGVGERFVITNAGGGGNANRSAITLYKSDSARAGSFLPGATFALYIGIPYSDWNLTVPPEGVAQTIDVGEMTFYFVEVQTTDGTGRALFDSRWLTPTHGAIYALVEIASPAGYRLPPDPVTLFSYIPQAAEQILAVGGRPIEQVADSIVIGNERTFPILTALPLTGGAGTALFLLGAVLLIGAGVIVVFWKCPGIRRALSRTRGQ